MAISRMQQPRQMYGLGSFVKKAVGKVTKPFTKVARKLVPKELAGIMRVAAPFLPPGYREAAYLLGTAKQTGRISPVDLALVLAPQIGKMKVGDSGLTVKEQLGALDVPFTDKSLSEVLVGAPRQDVPFQGPTMPKDLVGSLDPGIATETIRAGNLGQGSIDATSGLFGKGGKMFQLGEGFLPGADKRSGADVGIFDTKAGRALFGKEKGGEFVPSFAKLAGFGTAAISAVTAAETPEQAGNALVAETGDPAAYEEGVRLFSTLKPGVFDIREQFRLPAQAGGLMRENYALGTMPTAQESGLGGLPIEADMRYTGGFMPYGAKEKADDVPARLSKNEFVFTADAVRAAGGGSVQKGAQRMYNTMKQLESKPEAKGMMA